MGVTMYMLSLSSNGEITSTTVYASVVDATNDYADAVTRYATEFNGEAVATVVAVNPEDAAHTVIGGESHSTYWHDTRDTDGTHTVEITDETPNYRATLSRVTGEDIDPATFVASRAVEIVDPPTDLSAGTVDMAEIMAQVAREFVAA